MPMPDVGRDGRRALVRQQAADPSPQPVWLTGEALRRRRRGRSKLHNHGAPTGRVRIKFAPESGGERSCVGRRGSVSVCDVPCGGARASLDGQERWPPVLAWPVANGGREGAAPGVHTIRRNWESRCAPTGPHPDQQDRVNQARATAGAYLLTMPLAPAMYQFHFFFLSISGRSNANWNFLLLRESIRISTVGSGGRPA